MPDGFTMAPLAEAAIGLGLPVFPCNGEKHPVVGGGFKAASADPAIIARLFATPGAELIAMPTGRASGLVAIDVDVKAGAQGDAWLQENAEALPQTRTHKTRSGGLHLLFRCPEGVEIRNSASRVAPGVDVRGEGGYVIVPPSPGYAVADPAEPAEMPRWLIRACMPPAKEEVAPPPRQSASGDGSAYGLAALDAECDAILRAPFGQQETTLNAAGLKIGALIAGGELAEGYALARLIASGRAMPDQPGRPRWAHVEVERKVRRAVADGQRSPRQAPERPHTRAAARPAMNGHAPAAPQAAAWPDATLADRLSLAGWDARHIEPVEPLLGEAFTRTSRAFLGGPTGRGKTHIAMGIAAGIATGDGFLHWRATRPARVLYFDGEMARDLLQERLRDLMRRHPEALLRENLFALCADDFEALVKEHPGLGPPAPLNTEAGHQFMLNVVEFIGGVEFVVFDNRMSLLVGDMKDEVPWTDTMPLVKALTAKRIGQLWIDHTGHDAGHIYGSKTKEWQFDSVILARPVEGATEDIALTLEFTKARRRKPTNRADFETVTVKLIEDEWHVSPADGHPRRDKVLTTKQAGWLSDIEDLFATGAPVERVPLEGMRPILTLSREEVRAGLRVRGRFEADPHAPLTPKDRTALKDALNALKDAGKIGLTDTLVWLT